MIRDAEEARALEAREAEIREARRRDEARRREARALESSSLAASRNIPIITDETEETTGEIKELNIILIAGAALAIFFLVK